MVWTQILFPGNWPIVAEIARTPIERAKGLANRASLPWREGMLFVFDAPGDHAFWMQQTYIPLDVIFLDADLVVVGVIENMQPHDTTSRRLGRASSYALEVSAGYVRANNIRIGQQAAELH
jgi:uncharacterized protein